MTNEELQAIKDRHTASTEGEWKDDSGVVFHVSPLFGRIQIARAYVRENVVFIATAHTDIPALVAEVERLRAELNTAQTTLELISEL